MFVLDLDFTYKDFGLFTSGLKHKLKHVAISIFTPELESETYQTYKDRIILTIRALGLPAPSCRAFEYKCEEILFLLLHLVDKLFKGQRENVYDFIDYGDYIKSFIKIFLVFRRELKKMLKEREKQTVKKIIPSRLETGFSSFYINI